ncbi:glycosyl transferase, group 1 [Rhizorhabdus wittichii RW1]|uniref:Glycosyl transferase, group 1 n=1 Tax=Rhizorhabdus wittichii (strain DSM 6014 / CCUG 31198 / JCM 15750 / NBRC 105917 / EY 4224 / RW1) TaxID=392499 RepID=A0A9J9HEJ8_RHIWR|nr:glycosyl transferase, group 1 [Rhizorhabdus wittichii RW1]
MSTLAAPRDAASSPLLPAGVEIILDLSRLLSRTLHAMPTGIDRVELVYARQLLDLVPDRLRFAAVNPFGVYGRLPHAAVLRFLDETEARWAERAAPGRRAMTLAAARTLARLAPRPVPRPAPGVRRYYVQASPHHLHRPERVRAKLRAEQARFICLVHDLIPIEFPEYARPNGAATHRLRIGTMAALADGLIANSQATADSMARFLTGTTPPPIRVAHLGCDPLPEGDDGPLPIPAPYFVVLSTIEPRKNHLLLLHVWRRMAETLGPERTPHLAIVGRRGWENENVLDMLERCEAIRGHVHELAGLSDRGVAALLRNARALLLPSFAEGFGMPVTEALMAGTPAICSDLPALREAGGAVPEFLDPLDGPAWADMILDYAADRSERRDRQMERLRGWTPPGWRGHIATVLDLVRELDSGGSGGA